MAHLRPPLPAPLRARIREAFRIPLASYLRRVLEARPLRRRASGGVRHRPESAGANRQDLHRHAVRGEDPECGRGSTPFNREQRDPLHGPNPCVAPIEHGPFYAVKVLLGSFGTFAGLKTIRCAQVLRPEDDPIRGLYAVGTDMVQRHGWLLSFGRHQPRSGNDIRVRRRVACRRGDSGRERLDPMRLSPAGTSKVPGLRSLVPPA